MALLNTGFTALALVAIALVYRQFLLQSPDVTTTTSELSYIKASDYFPSPGISMELPCVTHDMLNSSHTRRTPVRGCTPVNGRCGRHVIDDFLTEKELGILRRMALLGREIQRGDDVRQGDTINFHSTPEDPVPWYHADVYAGNKERHFTNGQHISADDLKTYRDVSNKVLDFVTKQYSIEKLYFCPPHHLSVFIAEAETKSLGYNYSFAHRDQVYQENWPENGSFAILDYTATLYLSTVGEDIKGGAFQFQLPKNGHGHVLTVEPRRGRLLTFTSGDENPHQVLPVTKGTRLALQMWLTCSSKWHGKHVRALDGRIKELEGLGREGSAGRDRPA